MFFYKPDYLQDDFEDMVSTLGESLTLNYDEATPTTFNGLITQLDFKGNLKGTLDDTRELVVSLDLDIKKGDYVTDSNSTIYICTWQVFSDVNCKSTQIQICNYDFTFERWQGKTIDSDGVTATPASYSEIANVYGYLSRINQGTFDSREGQVGIQGTQKLFVGIKYTSNTSNIQIHDEFDYFNQRYEITDIDYTQINNDNVSGILFVYAAMKSGGENAIT